MTKTPASSKPRYPIPWIVTYFLTALVLIVGSFVIVWYVNQLSSDYDYNDPDMTFLERFVLSPRPGRADFTSLNRGDWQVLCLVGWNGNAKAAMKAASVSQQSTRALLDVYDRIAPQVEETEFVLIYVNGKGAAKAVHHPHGFAFALSDSAQCTTRAHPVLELPVRP